MLLPHDIIRKHPSPKIDISEHSGTFFDFDLSALALSPHAGGFDTEDGQLIFAADGLLAEQPVLEQCCVAAFVIRRRAAPRRAGESQVPPPCRPGPVPHIFQRPAMH